MLSEVEAQSEQSEEQKKIANFVRTEVSEARSKANRIAHEGIWMTNIAYLLGYAGIVYNTQTKSFQPVNRFHNGLFQKSRMSVNKILPTVQNRQAKLCKNAPKFDVMPESNSQEDKEAARLALQTLMALWNKLSINEKNMHVKMWCQQAGHSWVRAYWDDCAGKPMLDPLTGEYGYEGDVALEVLSPFEVYPDPSAKTEEDVLKSHVTVVKVRKLDYFKKHYPEYGELVKQEEAWLLSVQYENRINSLNTRGPTSGNATEMMKNCAIELTRYEAASIEYPKGRMIVAANGILLADKDLPIGEIPMSKFDDVMIAGKLFSEAIITHLRPVQDNYNEVIRRRADWVRKQLSGKHIAARGSGLTQEAMNDESGEIVYYTPVPNAPDGGRPVPLQMPNIPQYAYMEEERLDKQFNDISGISEVSRGDMPSASIPAIGMQLLVEQDDTRVGVVTEQHEHSWAKIGKYILKFVEFGYEMPRKLKMAGPNNEYLVNEVAGYMLKGNTDVTVIRGSTSPGSKVLRNQEIMSRYDRGLLGDPNDPKVKEKINAMTEFGDVSDIWIDYGTDMSQIHRGMDMLKNLQPVIVSEFDNHAMWLQELNRFRKTEKFDSAPPELQALILQNMEEHVQYLIKLSNQGPVPPPPPTAEEMNVQSGLTPDGQPQLPQGGA